MRLCILETGKPADEMFPRFGRYGGKFARWLSPAMPDATFDPVAVIDGEPLPDVSDYDGYVITGSRHGAYDDIPWIAPLEAFLREARERAVPVAGICFGHQIMAQAYGGTVIKHPDGWVLGLEHYGEGDARRGAQAFHQDQVVALPDGVRHVCGSPRCAHGRLEYAFPALSVQYHPEFEAPYVSALLDRLGGVLMPKEQAEEARATLEMPNQREDLAREFAAFFAANSRG